MDQPETFLDGLVQAIVRAASYNSLDQEAPVAILWPDEVGDWEPFIPSLRARLPVYSLGPYAREQMSGPVPWLRCAVASVLPDVPPADVIPVVYLPGVSARQLRGAERAPDRLVLLAELRYRSVLWTQRDGRDWTIATFLQSAEDGLGIPIRNDDATLSTLRRVSAALAKVTLSRLREDAPWKAKDLDALIGLPTTSEPDIGALIKRGESAQLEFKSTARWDFKNNRKFPVLEQVIVKTVAAFLNSYQGGTLLIGVEDDGTIHGIEDDYKAWSRPEKQNPDQYELWLTGDLLLKAFGKEFAPYIKVTFHHLDSHVVCKVDVAPAPMPAYAREKKDGRDEENFYVRTGNQSPALSVREAVEYIRKRWG